MKRILPVIILVAIGALITYKLISNKEKLEESTTLAEALVERVPVTSYKVVPLIANETLEISGKISAENDLMLTSTTQGQIQRILVRKGDLVQPGQVIATVEDDLLKEQFQVAKSAYDKLKKDEERFRIMAESEAITQQQLEGLEINLKQAEAKYLASKKQLDDTRIKSPIKGYINQLFINEGGVLGPGVPVCEIVNTSRLTLSLKIAESQLSAVDQGQEVAVTTGSSAVDTLRGLVTFLSVKPDYANQYTVDITLSQEDASSGAGRLATAHFPRTSDPEVTYVPEGALLGFGEEVQYVFRVEDLTARKVVVRPIERIAGYVGVQGLGFNDEIILRGNSIVSDGQLITLP